MRGPRVGAAATGPPRPHPRLRPAALYILPPGTGRDFYSGRASLPPPFGAGPAGQTDGRTDLLPKHNSTSSPERRTSTRRINATLDRSWSVGLMYPGLGLRRRRRLGRLGCVFPKLPLLLLATYSQLGWGRFRPSAGSGGLSSPGGTLLRFAGVSLCPVCKRANFFQGGAARQAKSQQQPPPKAKQLSFLLWQGNLLGARNWGS